MTIKNFGRTALVLALCSASVGVSAGEDTVDPSLYDIVCFKSSDSCKYKSGTNDPKNEVVVTPGEGFCRNTWKGKSFCKLSQACPEPISKEAANINSGSPCTKIE